MYLSALRLVISKIGNLVDKTPVLCAVENVLTSAHRRRHKQGRLARLLIIHRSLAWIEEHGSASRQYEGRNYLDGRHLEGRELHDRGAGLGGDIHRYEGGSAAHQKLLAIPEIVVVTLDRDPAF